MTILSVENVGKAFRRYHSEWHRFARWIGVKTALAEESWVLRGIDFEIHPGEAIGIVGENGAGKSTLLKIITGTLKPTEGTVTIRGRIAAILELGMGFNAELTGRQNVYHAAGLMGFNLDEIGHVMADIESFAGIGDYFDQAVRTYSSGMHVRVAFAVATAYRPEVLIIDEALSVGDTAFQRKCFRRIEDYQKAGTTLLFVSHDIESVKKLCDRAIFLSGGVIQSIGDAKGVCDDYEKHLFGGKSLAISDGSDTDVLENLHSSAKFDSSLAASCELVYGNGKADIDFCWFEDLMGEKINVLESGMPFRWCYQVSFNAAVDNPVFAMMLKTREGIALYGVDTAKDQRDSEVFESGDVFKVTFELENSLAPGEYFLNCGVRCDTVEGVEFLSRRIDSAILRVTSAKKSTVLIGMIEMNAKLSRTKA